MLGIGDKAADFTALDCQGRTVRLSDFRGRRVVLFFFPRAFTPGCTAEVRHFEQNLGQIQAHNAELIGVSVDSLETQCKFAAKEKLSFTLIGDESREISRAYGVLWPLLKIDRRVTFVIDSNGVIESVIKHEAQVYRHLDDVLAQLASESGKPEAGERAASTEPGS